MPDWCHSWHSSRLAVFSGEAAASRVPRAASVHSPKIFVTRPLFRCVCAGLEPARAAAARRNIWAVAQSAIGRVLGCLRRLGLGGGALVEVALVCCALSCCAFRARAALVPNMSLLQPSVRSHCSWQCCATAHASGCAGVLLQSALSGGQSSIGPCFVRWVVRYVGHSLKPSAGLSEPDSKPHHVLHARPDHGVDLLSHNCSCCYRSHVA